MARVVRVMRDLNRSSQSTMDYKYSRETSSSTGGSDLAQQLMYSAQKGDLQLLKCLLKQGCDVNITNRQGDTALMFAVVHNHVDCANELIRCGSIVTAVNRHGYSPLTLSALLGEFQILKSIIFDDRVPFDPNVKVASGRTMLMIAVLKGEAKLADKLIERGSLIDATDEESYTALMYAVISDSRGDNAHCTRILLSKKPDVKIRDANGETALMKAVMLKSTECVKLLVQGKEGVNIPANSSCTPLIEAARSGQLAIVKSLLQAGADISMVDSLNQTALMKAAQKDHATCVEELAGCPQCEIDHVTSNGVTALMMAANRGFDKCVEILIKHKANVNASDDGGVTSLMMTAFRGFGNCAKLLIAARTDVNMQDIDGVSALMRAAEVGDLELLELLIEAGAQIGLKNKYGETASEYAQHYCNVVAFNRLRGT